MILMLIHRIEWVFVGPGDQGGSRQAGRAPPHSKTHFLSHPPLLPSYSPQGCILRFPMQIEINIQEEGRIIWQRLSAGWWAGRVFHEGKWLSTQEVEALLEKANTIADLQQLLSSWNGHFALLWSKEQLHVAATDIGRSIPVFWQVANAKVTLSNRPNTSGQVSWWQQNEALVQSEFIPGHATLWQGWQQLQAGELLEVKNGLCYIHNYFPHRRPASKVAPKEELRTQFNELLEGIFDRLISLANGRPIVIPLSGGYDSRIIAAGLHRKNYPQLKAFTYGQAGSTEVRIGQEVADSLGIEWQFVAYDQKLLSTFGQQAWKDYASYAGKGCVLAQEQDYFALQQLQTLGWLEAGSLIVPGYCGDFQAGSYLPGPQLPWPPSRKKRLHAQLLSRFLRQADEKFRQAWQPQLPHKEIQDDEHYISELEHWVLREYVSKYIVNGVRAYEWFHCNWHLPLWDKAFITFWQNVPNSYRKDMRLYREVLAQDWFASYGIQFPEDQMASDNVLSPGTWLPPNWKKRLKQYLPSRETTNVNGLQLLIPLIQEQLSWPDTDLSKSVNEMIGHWYHDFLKNNRV